MKISDRFGRNWVCHPGSWIKTNTAPDQHEAEGMGKEKKEKTKKEKVLVGTT